MNWDELQRFRVILSSKREELIKRGQNREALAVEKLADPLDRGVQAASRECAAMDQERSYGLLQETLQALQRIEDGTFGLCLRCDEGIDLRRINALPWASRCVKCQESVDKSKPSGPQCARMEMPHYGATYAAYERRQSMRRDAYSFE